MHTHSLFPYSVHMTNYLGGYIVARDVGVVRVTDNPKR